MNIKIYSDIACPFCYVGITRLIEAIDNKFNRDLVELEFKPFQLNPNLPEEAEKSYFEGLAENYNVSIDEAKEMVENVEKFGAEDGIVFNFEDLKNTNTFNGHKLISIAENQNKGLEASKILFDAYFNKGINVADKDELIKLGEKIGLNRELLKIGLDSEDLDRELNAEIVAAQFSGVYSVPYFIFDNYYSLKGAQPIEVFEEVLKTTLEEANEI